MDRFAALFTALDQTTRTSVKTAALADYFRTAPDDDALWTIALLSGRRPKRTVTTTQLRDWAAEIAQLPPWLFEECYTLVGDLAETIALTLPPATRHDPKPLSAWIAQLQTLRTADDPTRKAAIQTAWDSLPPTERFVFNKLLTGGFRMGVSQKLMTRALAQAKDIPEPDLAHRLMGDWTPDSTTLTQLLTAPDPAADRSKPYPFALAHGLDAAPDTLGTPADWLAEWKWDGIRAQVIRRGPDLHIWSRGEDLITPRFPDLSPLLDHIPPGTVLDGELLAWNHDTQTPLPFATLQKRLGHKTVPRKLLAEAPVILHAYDLLEWAGQDIRAHPLHARRALLETLVQDLPPDTPLRLSPQLPAPTWDALAQARSTARAHHAEGLMLKRRDSAYATGRKRGDWWKWKLDPLTIDAVMIYAQAGHGRRAGLYTDFTFAVWKGNELVPFTKAYSGLTDAEFGKISAWVRKNTLERFGPVRRVPPELVFEIAFEGIQASSRHKSGVALRFPRMLRWRTDKPADQANTHADLLEMLATYG